MGPKGTTAIDVACQLGPTQLTMSGVPIPFLLLMPLLLSSVAQAQQHDPVKGAGCRMRQEGGK